MFRKRTTITTGALRNNNNNDNNNNNNNKKTSSILISNHSNNNNHNNHNNPYMTLSPCINHVDHGGRLHQYCNTNNNNSRIWIIIFLFVLPIISFAVGFLTCHYYNYNFGLYRSIPSSATQQQQQQQQNQVKHSTTNATGSTMNSDQLQIIENIPYRKTSHVGIQKQQFIEPFVLLPNLAGISIASIEPGQSIEQHSHRTMYEFFYILSGTITIEWTKSYNTTSSSSSSITIVGNDNNITPTNSKNQTINNTDGNNYFMEEIIRTLTTIDNESIVTTTTTRTSTCSIGCFFVAYPGDIHSFSNVHNNATTTKMLVIGLTTD